jgi:hypothetical protein
MKNKIIVLIAAALLTGCGSNLSSRQAVINVYKTTEVISCIECRGNFTDFIVRDTNGAVWFVDVRYLKGKLDIYSATLLFDKIKKVDKTKIEE